MHITFLVGFVQLNTTGKYLMLRYKPGTKVFLELAVITDARNN